MELRVLQYFLAVAREQSILGASEFLHLSQPTLSRQLKELEEELGKQLFIRGNRRITLTEEGMILRKRAEEIMQLVKKTENEITLAEQSIAGNIFIGAGETDAVRLISRAQQAIQKEHPLVHFHMQSGDKLSITENLDKGLNDFGLVFGEVDSSKYESLKVPYTDTWGILMRRDCTLAKKEQIEATDLWNLPLIVSRQESMEASLLPWSQKQRGQLNIVATYNLLFNASLMVREGLGYAVCLDKIINITGESELCFRPLYPKVHISTHIIWKKYQIFSKAAGKFLEQLYLEVEKAKNIQ